MAKETTKLKVSVELNNGDFHRVECDTIEMDRSDITVYGKGIDLTIKYEDISLMSIFIEDESKSEKLTFRLVREPRVERED